MGKGLRILTTSEVWRYALAALRNDMRNGAQYIALQIVVNPVLFYRLDNEGCGAIGFGAIQLAGERLGAMMLGNYPLLPLPIQGRDPH